LLDEGDFRIAILVGPIEFLTIGLEYFWVKPGEPCRVAQALKFSGEIKAALCFPQQASQFECNARDVQLGKIILPARVFGGQYT